MGLEFVLVGIKFLDFNFVFVWSFWVLVVIEFLSLEFVFILWVEFLGFVPYLTHVMKKGIFVIYFVLYALSVFMSFHIKF